MSACRPFPCRFWDGNLWRLGATVKVGRKWQHLLTFAAGGVRLVRLPLDDKPSQVSPETAGHILRGLKRAKRAASTPAAWRALKGAL